MFLVVSGLRLLQVVLPRVFSHRPFGAHANALLLGVPPEKVLRGHGIAVCRALVAKAKWFSKAVVPIPAPAGRQTGLYTLYV